MKQALFFFLLLFLLMFTPLNSSTTMAQAPAAAPKASPPIPSSKPLVPTLPDPTPYDVIGILEKAKTFRVLTWLLEATEIMDNINSLLITAKNRGLTILAPDDNAFSHLKAGFLISLDEGQKIQLLLFHMIPFYVSSSNLDSSSNPVQTVAGLASKDPTRLQLNVISYGEGINISTGVINATVTGVVYSENNKLAIYGVNKVLLPLNFFVTSKAPAAAKAPKAENPSAEAEDPTIEDHFSSGTMSLISAQGTMLASLVIALVAVAMLWG